MLHMQPPDQLLAEDDSRDSLPPLQRSPSPPHPSTSTPPNPFLSLLAKHNISLPPLSPPSSSSHPPRPPPSLIVVDSPDRLRLALDTALPDGSPAARAFYDGLIAHATHSLSNLRRLMTPTSPSPSPSPSSHLPLHRLAPTSSPPSSSPFLLITQDSLLQTFLKVLSLQRPLLEWLLHTLATDSQEWLSSNPSHPHPSSPPSSLSPASLPRLFLAHLRYLDVVYDWSHLVSTLLDVLDTSLPPPISRELIASLPSLIDPLYHPPIATHLTQTLLPSHPDLTLPILDALSNMTLPPPLSHSVVSAITARLPTTDVKDLPVCVRFLLSAGGGGGEEVVMEVVKALRREVTLVGGGGTTGGGGGGGGRGRKGEKDEKEEVESGPLLIVGALRSGLQSAGGAAVAKAYLDHVATLKSPSLHTPLDVVLLFLLTHLHPTSSSSSPSSSPSSRLSRLAQSTLFRKLSDESLPSTLLHSVLIHHPHALLPLFDTITRLAEAMVRHPNPRLRLTGSALQSTLFHSFPSHSHRRRLVEHLLQHLGSRVGDEMTAALHSLTDIAVRDRVRLRQYYAFIKTTLQYLDDYTLQHIRQLFHVLALLAVDTRAAAAADPSSSSSAESDVAAGGLVETTLMIFIRKELQVPSCRDQRIGLVGLIAVMEQLAPFDSPSPPTSLFVASQADSSHRHTLSPLLHSELQRLFHLLHDSTTRSPSCLSFLYDEFSHAIHTRALHPDLLDLVYTHYRQHFEPLLIIELPSPSTSHPRVAAPPLPSLFPSDPLRAALACHDAAELFPTLLHQITDADSHHACQVAINILPALSHTGTHTHALHQVYMMPAELRLMAACELSKHGHLIDIDALLVAPITLPRLEGERLEERVEWFKALSERGQRLVLSSLLHCANWWRELINAWTALPEQRGPEVVKVLQRLQQLMDMEEEMKAYVNALRSFSATQLLGMGDTTDPLFVREMASLEGSVKAGDEAQQYTNIGKKAVGRVVMKKKGKGKKKAQKKRRRMGSDSDSHSGDGSSSDDSRAEKRKAEAKRKAQAKAAKTQGKEGDDVKHFHEHIRPHLRSFHFSVFRLLQQPPSSYLLHTAEAISTQRRERRSKKRQRANGGDGQPQQQGSKRRKGKDGVSEAEAGEEEQKQPREDRASDDERDESEEKREMVSRFPSHSLSQPGSFDAMLPAPSLLYLLQDLAVKMKAVLSRPSSLVPLFSSSSTSSKKPIASHSSHQLTLHSPHSLLCDLLPLLPGLHLHFTVLHSFLQTSDVDDDESIDRAQLLDCLLHLIGIIRIIVLSPALRSRSCRPLVLQALQALLGQDSAGGGGADAPAPPPTRASLKAACESMFDFLCTSLTSLTSLDDAVAVVTVMHALLDYTSAGADEHSSTSSPASNARHDPLSTLAGHLLSREWHHKCSLKKSNVGRLVALHLHHAPQPVQLLAQLSKHVLKVSATEEGEDEEDDDDVGLFHATLGKKSAPLFIAPLLDEALQLLRATKASVQRSDRFLVRLLSIVQSVHDLAKCLRHFPTSSALHASALRTARLLLDRLTRLLPSIRPFYKDSALQGRVKPLLPSIQLVTRLFHAVCEHGKDRGVRSVIRLTPQWKKAADAFIFAVKSTLKEAGLQNIFTQGQLKNKKLDGGVILTQPPQQANTRRRVAARKEGGGRRGTKEEEQEEGEREEGEDEDGQEEEDDEGKEEVKGRRRGGKGRTDAKQRRRTKELLQSEEEEQASESSDEEAGEEEEEERSEID